MQDSHGPSTTSLSPQVLNLEQNNLEQTHPVDSPSSKHRRFRLPLQSSAPQAASVMGQNQSTPAPPSTGQRFRRALTMRRKTADDAIPPPSPSVSLTPSHAPSPVGKLFSYRKQSLIGPPPPLPPTKPLNLRSPQSPNVEPLIINSSGISAAVQVTTDNNSDDSYFPRHERRSVVVTDQMKEDWRKSDSTATSHHTIRATAGSSRNPRPVSVAESSHSSSTIMNKRLSMMITDVELVSPQESDAGSEDVYVAIPREKSATGALNAHRRSISLSPFKSKLSSPELRTEPPAAELAQSRSREPLPVLYKTYTPALNRTAANGFIAPSNTSSQPAGNQIKGRLAAWTATTAPPPQHAASRAPPPPSSYTTPQPVPGLKPPNFRQTAVSITGNLAPAAMDLGKRAMEKMGRAWGSRAKPDTASGYSSSPGEVSSLSSKKKSNEMGRYHANDSTPSQISSFSTSAKKKRRTPDAPSGSWSITSSVSDESCPTLSSINSSKCMRGPLASGGLVFGRRLKDCVRDTAVDGVRLQLISGEYFGFGEGLRPLDQRLLPAIVVRCVQHLLTWGIQEEGLFRMNGRSSHTREMRQEFDQGVDYDISECAPCDIDPHVISSLFKLYLRELPEPLLTHELMPYFDAVMTAEDNINAAKSQASNAQIGGAGPTLPTSPKTGIRKPPSLSTLSMPNLAGMRAASQSSVNAIATLISRLPRENRDLLLTLTELMKATAIRSKQTKMPLANLLLVFCPSLNMKPSLLRVLCESDDIWRKPRQDTEVPIIDQSPMHSRESSLDSIDDDSVPDTPISLPTRGRGRRGPIATIYGEYTSSSSSSLNPPGMASSDSVSYQDDSSDLSFSDVLHRGKTITRKPSPPLSSSMESLATPSTSSESPSFLISSAKEEEHSSMSYTSPLIADEGQLSLHPSTPRTTLVISTPVPFPATPATPLSARKSSPSLTSPTGSARLKRPSSRPSLNMLFSKKSESSLRSASISAPIPIISPEPPRTAAPVLDMPINTSPLLSGFTPIASQLPAKPELKVAPNLTRLRSISSTATDSPRSSTYATPTESFMSASSDRTAEPFDKYTMGMGMVRSASRLSIAIGAEDPDHEDDWTGSVLRAVNDQLPVNDR